MRENAKATAGSSKGIFPYSCRLVVELFPLGGKNV
jgi:hypothetical protein